MSGSQIARPGGDDLDSVAGGLDEAFRHGLALFRVGRDRDACAWLDRAARLSNRDDTVVLALAAAQQRVDPGKAGATLAGLVADSPDCLGGWLALLAARLATCDTQDAVRVAGQMLTRFTVRAVPSAVALLDRVVRDAGLLGWVDADVNGWVVARVVASSAEPLAVIVDGRVVASPANGAGRGTLRARLPAWGRAGSTLAATVGGVALLGSGLDLRRRRVVGLLDWDAGDAVVAWAWLPADPATPPGLVVQADGARPVRLGEAVLDRIGAHLLSRPRDAWRFTVPDPLVRACANLAVRGRDGGALWGSPVQPDVATRTIRRVVQRMALATYTAPLPPAEPDDWRPLPVGIQPSRAVPPAAAVPPARCCVVIPVLNQFADVARCLGSVLAALPSWAQVIVVDDGSSEPEVAGLLAGLAHRGQATVLRNQAPQGFPKAANAGLRAALAPGDCDVVLLNSDTVVAPGWLDRLRRTAYAAADIGSVTPLSCDGSIVSHPNPDRLGDVTEVSVVESLDERLGSLNRGLVAELPSGVGFCLFVTAICLAETGLLRETLFTQGYGEENDWCLRARLLGWRHVAALDVFVAHLGGRSFGLGRDYLTRRNAALLERLHPGYAAFVAGHGCDAEVRRAWRRIDAARLRADSVPGRSILLVSHGLGGGVQRSVRSRIAAFNEMGLRALVLLPSPNSDADGCALIQDADQDGLRYDLPSEAEELAGLLRDCGIRLIEIHHLLGHGDPMVRLVEGLGVPFNVYVHDYAAWCPRLHLTSYGDTYCGEPDQVQACDACVRDLGSATPGCRSVGDYRRASGELLHKANACYVPSMDVKARLGRQFPALRVTIVPWEAASPNRIQVKPKAGPATKAVVLGAIGVEKGYQLLLACARDAASRGLPLSFHVIGFTIDDARLMETGRVFVSGRYREGEVAGLLEQAEADLGFVPSACPETWCFALSELMASGLPVATLDIGTQAERVAQSRRGLVLPRNLPAAAVNDALLHHAR